MSSGFPQEQARGKANLCLPWARDAREAVPGLCVPHADLACQAAAHQQHPIASQTLDVLHEGAVLAQAKAMTACCPRTPPPSP